MVFRSRPPAWFWAIAVLLTVWSLIGCYFCYMQFKLGAGAMPDATDYDRTLYASLPGWYIYVYAIAVGSGALGGLALLARSAAARPILIVSLIAIVFQFGYLFATTDVIAAKGFANVVTFPAFIAAVSIFAVWFAGMSKRRGWIR